MTASSCLTCRWWSTWRDRSMLIVYRLWWLMLPQRVMVIKRFEDLRRSWGCHTDFWGWILNAARGWFKHFKRPFVVLLDIAFCWKAWLNQFPASRVLIHHAHSLFSRLLNLVSKPRLYIRLFHDNFFLQTFAFDIILKTGGSSPVDFAAFGNVASFCGRFAYFVEVDRVYRYRACIDSFRWDLILGSDLLVCSNDTMKVLWVSRLYILFKPLFSNMKSSEMRFQLSRSNLHFRLQFRKLHQIAYAMRGSIFLVISYCPHCSGT
jgi:hypothetical protein